MDDLTPNRVAAHVRELHSLFGILLDAPERPAPDYIAIGAWGAVFGIAEGVDTDRRQGELLHAVAMAAILLDWGDSPASRRLARILWASHPPTVAVTIKHKVPHMRRTVLYVRRVWADSAAWEAILHQDGVQTARSVGHTRPAQAIADVMRTGA